MMPEGWPQSRAGCSGTASGVLGQGCCAQQVLGMLRLLTPSGAFCLCLWLTESLRAWRWSLLGALAATFQGTAVSLVKSLRAQSVALPRNSERPSPTNPLPATPEGRILISRRVLGGCSAVAALPLRHHAAPRVRGSRAPALPKAEGWREGGTAPPSPALEAAICPLLAGSEDQAGRKFTFQVIGWHIKTFILFGQINEQFN